MAMVNDNLKSNLFNETSVNSPKEDYSFFEHIPIAIFVQDFSQIKQYIITKAEEQKVDVKSFLLNTPDVIHKINSLHIIKEVNNAAVKLYKAKNKEDLLGNLQKMFTKKSYTGFIKLVLDILLGEKTSKLETVNKTFEGDEIDILINFKVQDGYEETLEKVFVTVENITERVRDRKKLIESENRYKEAQKIAKIGSWSYIYATNELYWSSEAYQLLGIQKSKRKLDLEFYLSFVHEEDKKLVDNFEISYLLKNPHQNFSYRLITSKGELIYLQETRNVICEGNRVIKIIGIFQNITENILAERNLNSTKNLLSNTISSINDGFVILDKNSNYLYVNKKAEILLGKNSSELLGKNIWVEFPEKEGDVFYDSFHKAIETNTTIHFENYFEPWNKWFDNRIIPYKDGVSMFFEEITEKKKAENKIKEAYNIINKSSSVAFLTENKYDFPVVFVSENSKKLFGYSYKEFLSGAIKLHEVIHPDDLPYIRSEVFKLTKSTSKREFKTNPFRIITRQGNIKWLKANIDLIHNEQEEITHIQGIVENITEQKIIEDQLFESNQRLKETFNHTPLASIMWDLDMKVLDWNKSAERIFGYTKEEAIGKSANELILTEDIIEEISEVKKQLLAQKGGFKYTNINKTKNGSIISCDWYNVTLKDVNGNITGMASLVEDITEKIDYKKQIEKSEKKYREIFQKSIDPVFVLNNGIFIEANEAAIKLFGFETKDDLLKIHPSEISPEKQPNGKLSFDEANKVINIAIEKGFHRFIWYHKNAKGRVFPAEVTLTKIEEFSNSISIHAVVKDITDRVKQDTLEDVLYNISKAALTINDFKQFSFFIKKQLELIINTNNFYIALCNKKTGIISTPIFIDEKEEVEDFPAENSLTGYVIKTKKPLLLTNDEHQQLIKKGEVSLIGSSAECWLGVPLIIKDDAIGAIVVQSYNNKDEYNLSDVNLLEFVADQISTTIQRKKKDDELKQALLKAQESDKLKSSFLANMSHEIRTPMNGIIGFSEFLLDPNLKEVNRKKYAKVIINSSKRLLSIVNDILDISKIEAGMVKLNYENVNLNHLLDDLYTFYKPIVEEQNLALIYNKEIDNLKSVVETDKNKLNQILTNLISNAIKFTNEGSIEFGCHIKNNMVEFYVKDTGIGIKEELIDKIFQRFTQADMPKNKQIIGTGLGLAISKKFVELFNGDIWLESSKKGTTVYFTIPYIKKMPNVSTVIEKVKNMVPNQNQKLTILVAEDEEYNRMYINELFSKTNYTIIEAYDGKMAIELFKKEDKIDLVLMDIKMPKMDGIEAMKIIKSLKSIPIIALSAFAMESDKVDALKEGFDNYLTKPINKKALFELINEYAN
ncbi:MAG: PAS domain S-box protein [Lutibacter sp.]|uniref:PAS domain-containing hybrid sensor histidine kinase/response regulator n=1 Tax=Lutibacter sp. TaxID=1925666 RepID=UPI00299CDA34|nr:PAS domain S-box protein [Lutibacter sp.]MDX1829777.1 PAS domain S-box protein [Lutibacter sp.]